MYHNSEEGRSTPSNKGYPSSGVRSNKAKRPNVLIVTDSRGKGLPEALHTPDFQNISLDINIRKGGTYTDFEEIIASHTADKQYHLIVIVGGICSFTSRERLHNINRKVNAITYKSSKVQAAIEILTRLRQELGRTLIVGTVPPASLIKYLKSRNRLVQHFDPALTKQLEAQQISLLQDLTLLNDWITTSNTNLRLPTLDLHRAVISSAIKVTCGKRRRTKRFTDLHLEDGVHADELIALRWHKRTGAVILSALCRTPLSTADSSTTDTQSESDRDWDHKRRKTTHLERDPRESTGKGKRAGKH